MQKTDLEKMTASAREYFNSLPPTLQESIMQSGVTLTTRDQLESFCKNTLQPQQPKN